MALLGIDAGSSGCKAVVFTENGKQLSVGRSSYSPVVSGDGRVELDPEAFFDYFVSAVRQAVEASSQKIEAMAISSHGESIVPIAADGSLAGNMLMNSDNRAVLQAERLEKAIGRGKLYAITGSPPHPMFGLTKIMWRKQNGEDNACKYLSAGDYLLFRLGFEPLTDFTLASRLLVFDINTKKWSKEILAAADVSENELPVVVQSGTKVGRLSKHIAELLGLTEGVTVAAGGHDQPCGALGSGVIGKGDASVSAGTYECIAVASERPMNNAKALRFSLNSYCHVVNNSYVTLAFFPAGIGVRWFVEQFCGADEIRAEKLGVGVYELLDRYIESVLGPTGVFIVPHWLGACNPYWDVTATGKISGLTPACTRSQLYKAMFEGIAFELDVNLSALETLFGNISALRISGGSARSDSVIQLRADITGKAYERVNTSEAVCQGAAMLAGISNGTFSSFTDAVSHMVHIDKEIKPDNNMAQLYSEQRGEYARISGLKL